MPSGLPYTLPLAVLQAGLGTWQYLNAIHQSKMNQRPLYSINQEYQYNLDLLKSSLGLPQSALNLYYQNTGQQRSQGIDALLAGGGSANQISQFLNQGNRDNQNILAMDAMQRKQDLQGIIGAQTMLANEKDKAWQLNKYAPYADKAQAIAQEKQAGIQNIFGGLNSASGAFATDATSKLADSLSGASGMDKVGATGSASYITTPNSGVNINQIIKNLQGQTGFGAMNNQPNNLNFGINNQQYGLPNYSLYANLFGGGGGNNTGNFNPYDNSYLFQNKIF